MGGRARSLIRWLRHHRSRRVSSASSSSSSHLTATNTNTSSATTATSDLRARSLPQQQDEDDEVEVEVDWEEEEGSGSGPDGYIVLEREGEAGSLRVVVPRAPARTKPPPRMDPGKKVRAFSLAWLAVRAPSSP